MESPVLLENKSKVRAQLFFEREVEVDEEAGCGASAAAAEGATQSPHPPFLYARGR